jgi:serine phosphatase RsbU (regulator of sigma subunit)
MLKENINRWTAKFANGLVKSLGVFLLLFAIISILHGFFSLRVSFNEGRFGFNYDPNDNQKGILITSVVKGFPADQAGLKAGDRVLYVNGQPPRFQHSIWGDAVAGTQLVLTVQRGDQTMEVQLTRKLIPMLGRAVRVLSLLILPALLLAYILVGLWGVFKHPSFITNLIGLVCFFFGSMISSFTLMTTPSPFGEYFNFYQIKGIVSSISMLLAPAFWLFLFANFPQKAAFYKKHRYLATFLVFLFPAGILALEIFLPGIFKENFIGMSILGLFIGGYIFSGIAILSRGAKREKNILKKRQYQLILFGIKYGALAIFIGMCALFVWWFWMQDWLDYFGWLMFLIFLVTQVVGLMLPFTFLNSFFQHKILETETALRRRLRYLAATSALFLFYLLAAFFLNSWIISSFQLTDPAFIVLVVLIMSLTFSPLQTRVLRWLEEKLYPEKTRYKHSLQGLIKRMSFYIDESQLLENLSRWFAETMGISPIYAVSLEGIRVQRIPLKLQSPKSVLARIKDGSNFFWDEIAEDSGEIIDEEEKKWALQKGISITVPMIYRGEQVGILSIGKKKNREDFTGDDLEIFQEAANHTAVAIQNIRLQAEHLQKKRIEKELELARQIQTHLMPRHIPEIKGLQLHGENRPCYEVGGDYFDIIPMDEYRTALVIADVSGKGAGAALLMSNLQASLKMAVSLDLPLQDIVSKTNKIICENSLPSQFITFFIGVWDSRDNNLQYINAGHNPPFIVRGNNRIRTLTPTGIGLGIKENQIHQTKQIHLAVNDVLVIHTDGIEEFFNYRLEAFGVERMTKACKDRKHLHPRNIIQHLFQDLKDFAEGKEAYHCDDLTIIVVKRVN